MDSLLSGFSNIELPYYQLPSSVPSINTSILSSFAAMPRSSSAEPGKTTKRKVGARSVSTLSPAQLARKRANDREAQRAIRARTKEHIERLEAEVEVLKSQHGTDKRVQELLHRNQFLETENKRLKGEIGGSSGAPPPPPQQHQQQQQPSVTVTQAVGSLAGSPYSANTVYEDSLTTASGMPSPRTSPFSNADYSPLPDATSYAGAYIPIPSHHHPHHHHSQNATSHPHAHHGHQVGGPSSTGSSPASATTDPDYITAAGAAATAAPAYIPTSIPTSMQQHAPSGLITSAPNGLGDGGIHTLHGSSGHSTPPPGNMGFSSPAQPQQPQQQQQQGPGQQQQQQQWNSVYGAYYGRQVQSPVH